MPLMPSFSWHGPLTDTLTGCAERYPMPSSPTLQPQRGAGGMIFSSLVMLNSCFTELVDKTAVEDELNSCVVVIPVDDVGKSLFFEILCLIFNVFREI